MDSCELISTSFFVSPEEIKQAISHTENLGFTAVSFTPAGKKYFDKWAGTPNERQQQLENAFSNPSKCIRACLGGSGVIHFLSSVNFDSLLKHPRFVVGSSDLTPLLNNIFEQLGIITLHGPNAVKEVDEKTQKYLRMALQAEDYTIHFSSYESHGKKIVRGTIKGGNLAMCAWSLSSKFEIDLKNKIVFFEDIGTNFHIAYDRLVQLKNSKVLRPKAIIFGYLLEIKQLKKFIQAVQELFPNTPIIYGLPIGHQLPNLTIPIGAKTTLDFEKKTIKFTFSKQAKEYAVKLE